MCVFTPIFLKTFMSLIVAEHKYRPCNKTLQDTHIENITDGLTVSEVYLQALRRTKNEVPAFSFTIFILIVLMALLSRVKDIHPI